MKILLLTSILPDYRLPVFLALCKTLERNFNLAVSVSEKRDGFQLQAVPDEHLVPIVNRYFAGLQVQKGMWKKALQADVVIMELSPRLVTTWILLVIRKLMRKPSVLWGHAWPRSGSASRSDRLRHIMRKLGDVILVYTESQAIELKRKMPNKVILAAPNALYYQEEMVLNLEQLGSQPKRTDFIYVGRLVSEKKPALLLEAFLAQVEQFGPSTRLVFVGEGPERAALEAMVFKHGTNQVVFTGHLAGSEVLRPLYNKAIASVSPGYVGLSITQSFSFGVPMLISRDEPHAPEIEAAIEGVNSVFFAANSATALGTELTKLYLDRDAWALKGPAIIKDCMERYSVEMMSSRFIDAAEIAHSRR